VITIDDADARPPFEQIREQLTDQIRSGALAAGHRLPSVRQLAGDLRIAPGTVARAYSELEADGLLESSRTGSRVRAVDPMTDADRAAAREYIAAVGARSLEDAIRVLRVEWGARS
jgi:DNA-binding transcriptional regulator YhcF (GntR family)